MIHAIRELGNMKQGQTLLLHSAAGGCGSLALGICKQLKINVIATVGDSNKVCLKLFQLINCHLVILLITPVHLKHLLDAIIHF